MVVSTHRALSFTLIFVGALMCSVISAWGDNPPVQIKIETGGTILGNGDDVRIFVTTVNTSNQDIYLPEPESDVPAFGAYILYVKRENGGLAPFTEEQQGLYDNSEPLVPGIYRSTLLRPNDSVTADLHAKEIYDMTARGRYVIWVERKLPDELGGGYVASNSIRLTIRQ